MGDEALLRFEFKNTRDIDLLDLTSALSALGEAYQEFAVSDGHDVEHGNVRLYVRELRTGSVIADLGSHAEQISFVLKHLDVVARFLTHFNDIIQFFLGTKVLEPTKKEAEQVSRVMEPLAKDSGGNLYLNVRDIQNLTVNQQYFYNSQQANAVQNAVRRYLGDAIPVTDVKHDVLLQLHQMRGDASAEVGDRGIIEEVSPSPVKLQFVSEETKAKVLDQPFPFDTIFVCDVEVKAAKGRVALYRILTIKDVIQQHSPAQST